MNKTFITLERGMNSTTGELKELWTRAFRFYGQQRLKGEVWEQKAKVGLVRDIEVKPVKHDKIVTRFM